MDWPKNEFGAKLPILDPDIIGPDDFRWPFSKTQDYAQIDTAFDLWLYRRNWADLQLASFASRVLMVSENQPLLVGGQTVPSLTDMFEVMYDLAELHYPFQAPADMLPPWGPRDKNIHENFRELLRQLDRGEDIETPTAIIQNQLNLTVESFRRMMAIWDKDEKWRQANLPPQAQLNQGAVNVPRVSPEEWREVYSILLQAQKIFLRETWIQEEQRLNITLSTQVFWPAQRTHLEGEWPPIFPKTLPIIDPELQTLKDLAKPVIGIEVRSLWEDRRDALNRLTDRLKQAYKQSFGSLLQLGLGNHLVNQLETWNRQLAEKDTRDSAIENIENQLRLSVDDFRQLMVTKAKAEAAQEIKQELPQVIAILRKSTKYRQFYTEWAVEQSGIAIDTPIIDPDELNLKDLAEQMVGEMAINLWHQRQRDLQETFDDFEQQYQRKGLDDLFADALGISTEQRKALNKALNAGGQAQQDAERTIKNQLHLTVEDFNRSMDIQAKAQATEQYLEQVFTILVKSTKYRILYPAWVDEQKKLNLTYWQTLKARLPQWRAPMETRQTWQQALKVRSQSPVIDPDLLQETEVTFQPSALGSQAREIWQKRKEEEWLGSGDEKIDARDPGDSDLTAFRKMLVKGCFGQTYQDSLADGILSLEEKRADGEDITPRLKQLGLSATAFAYLIRCHKLLTEAQAGVSPLQQTEWDAIIAILVQATKQRWFSQWRDEEQRQGIILSPDAFQLVEPDPDKPYTPIGSDLPEWRANRLDYLDWRDKLEARIEQQTSTITTFAEAISSAEELILPPLRNALIEASNAQGTDLSTKAKFLTDRLLIDTQAGGCQKTTRISQAIETLQNLLWSIRTGQLYDTYDQLTLVESNNFDEEWQWMGSYATWRAAMFVFLYPENILIPSLRKHQTPAFRQLVSNLRRNRQLTPEQAHQEAKAYEDYLRDICNLKVRATCYAESPAYEENVQNKTPSGRSTFLYSIAQGTKKIYWSAHKLEIKNNKDKSEIKATKEASFWHEIPSVSDVISIVGAQPYQVSDSENYIFLFLLVKQGTSQQLKYLRFNLENQAWENELIEINVPYKATKFSVVLQQSHTNRIPPRLAIYFQKGGKKEIYFGQLNQDGSGLAEAPQDHNGRGNDNSEGWELKLNAWRGNFLKYLLAMVEISTNECCLFAISDKQEVRYRIFGPHDDGYWNTAVKNSNHFRGAFAWPKTNSSTFVYHNVHSPGNTFIQEVTCHYQGSDFVGLSRWHGCKTPSNDIGVGFKKGILTNFEHWLFEVTGLSLKSMFYRGEVEKYKEKSYFQVLTLPKLYSAGGEYKEAVDYVLARMEEVTARKGGWNDADKVCQKWTRGSKTIFQVLEDAVVRHKTPFFKKRNSQFSTRALKFSEDFYNHKPSIVPFSTYGIQSTPVNLIFVLTTFRNRRQTFFGNIYINKNDVTINAVTPTLPQYGFFSSIIEKMTQRELQFRKVRIQEIFLGQYKKGLESRFVYLEEAYYFVPILIAISLQKKGYFIAALNWFQTVFDYTIDEDDQASKVKISYVLSRKSNVDNTSYKRKSNWLLNPLDPHGIAASRSNTYTRFTLISIIRCLLEYANSEFSQDTVESLPKARTLYETALNILKTDALRQTSNACQGKIGELKIELEAVSPEVKEALKTIEKLLLEIKDYSAIRELIPFIRMFLKEGNAEDAIKLVKDAVRQDKYNRHISNSVRAVNQASRKLASDAHGILISNVVIFNSVAELKINSGRMSLESQRSSLLSKLFLVFGFCISPNPVLKGFKLQAELNLYKLRTCRNIAGMKREVEPYASPTDQISGLPQLGPSGQLLLPGTNNIRPTPYRYAFLLEQAKQLVNIAQQTEAAMLAAFEKRDAEAYTQLKARQDIQIAQSQVRLQTLRRREATSYVKLAELQEQRAQVQLEHFQNLITEGWLWQETASFAALATVSATYAVASILAAVSILGKDRAAGVGYGAQSVQFAAQALSQWASYERRKQGWEFQKNLATQDIRIGSQQVRIARDRVAITEQEVTIARLQTDHAKDTLEFLTTKFTNVELYDWMSGVLEGVYSYFLQEATAIAKLAENQLAFERQQIPPQFIQADYWEAPSEDMGLSLQGKAPDRRGLTGSARLLQDIYQLDNYALETDKRKLQLTKTLSLATLAPVEFQQFRETGVLTFRTTLDMFDRDFPGHYLRLIKRVRTSVLALIPPTQGIHATLSTTAASRVVIGGDIFQTVIVRRDPEQVALTSPQNATGLFELQQQSEMLLPFESLGVDTSWEFRMPKAANQFDYRTIADVLLTLDYTALNSYDYQQQVIQTLNPNISADRPFSFRHQFSDAWYDLHNPNQTAAPLEVTFETHRADFPPNVDRLKINHVVLYFARKAGETFEVPVNLQFTETSPKSKEQNPSIGGDATTVGGDATTVDGLISTRRGNASSWAMQGKSPIGKWKLSLVAADKGKEKDIRRWFTDGAIEDILFVITYKGSAPEWPE